jgi:hypothetical protein
MSRFLDEPDDEPGFDPESAFCKGWDDYHSQQASGIPHSNPYDPGTVEFIDWQGGFNEAQEGL